MSEFIARPSGDAPDSPWQTHSQREVYRNPWMVVTEYQVTRPDGQPGIYGVMDAGDNVTIVALDDQDRVLLIRDFVYPVQQWTWAVPGGTVEPGEDPQVAAARELAEEGGLAATEWIALGSYWLTCGISPETSYSFLARNLHPVEAHPEGTEVITHAWVPLAEALARCRSGDIRDATAVLALRAVEDWHRGLPFPLAPRFLTHE